MTGREVSREAAIERVLPATYKVELARDIPADEAITLYTIGDFTDLCRGGVPQSDGRESGAIKLTECGGCLLARGRAQSVCCSASTAQRLRPKKELDDYLVFLEEAAKRDHRKLGPELGFYR